MDNPLRNLKKIAEKISGKVSRVAEKFDSEDPLMVQPYRGFANENRIFLKGRVLEDENIFNGKSDNQIKNIINNFKRFETDEVPEANVRITCADQAFECKTDVEGYFTLDAEWMSPATSDRITWVPVTVELLYPTRADDSRISEEGEIMILSKNADYGVITDVDDTVLQTHVSSLFRLKMLYTTFLKNAHQRLPMEGMVKLFKSFVKGGDGKKENPIFYLSHSPWNIYDLLLEFFTIQEFPKGPILLRDYGITPSGEYSHHKITSIAYILKMYPKLPFVLLGDSADEDADFYIQVAREFPERIKAIYIRQTRNTKNAKRIKELIENSAHVDAVLIHSSDEINQHALELGLFAQAVE
ncbi:MAG: phosphatase domain-containing protein [Cyclobacteriaceae bacterium]